MSTTGTVYLLHFARPYQGRQQHYVGWSRNLERRLADHRAGTASTRTTKLAYAQGISFVVARTWPNSTQVLERQIKRSGAPNYCPLCRAT